MKLLKRIIIFAIIILIITVIILINLLEEKNKQVTAEDETAGEILGELTEERSKTVTQVDVETLFFTVSRCVQMYFTNSYYVEDVQQSDGEHQSNVFNAIYSMLSKEYMEKNKITEDNISEHIKTYDVPIIFYPISMNYLDGEHVQAYSVYGYIENSNTGEYIKDLYCIVNLDRSNKTFSIEILDETKINNINEINLINNGQSIEKNDYNTFRYIYIKEEILAEKYLDCYKRYAKKYPEKAYNVLEEEYRNARFGNIDSFKEYVNNNAKTIEEITLDKYQATKKDGYTEYICIDTAGNYYIFRETATMQFTLLLDTYTIDIPEFTQKYRSGNEQAKVAMNIEKIVEALNSKDYGYLYRKLADGFKNNYFKTQAEFEAYAKNNFYDKNTVTYNEFAYEGQNYMYSITIKNDNGYTRDKTIIMQLKDNNDFVFSFNV